METVENVADVARRTFGESVRKYRLANEWTQDTLAKVLGVHGLNATQTMIAKIERGDRPTSISEAAVIAASFGVPVQALLPLDKASATHSHLGMLLSNFNTRLKRYRGVLDELMDMEQALEAALDEWDAYVKDFTPEELEYLAGVDIDARSSSENGMRESLRGEHSEEA